MRSNQTLPHHRERIFDTDLWARQDLNRTAEPDSFCGLFVCENDDTVLSQLWVWCFDPGTPRPKLCVTHFCWSVCFPACWPPSAPLWREVVTSLWKYVCHRATGPSRLIQETHSCRTTPDTGTLHEDAVTFGFSSSCSKSVQTSFPVRSSSNAAAFLQEVPFTSTSLKSKYKHAVWVQEYYLLNCI